MENITDVGYQKTISINGNKVFLDDPFNGHPVQDVEQLTYIQGGPRNFIYHIGKKMVNGSFTLPIVINGSGDIDGAIKELLLCAEYPLKSLEIDTNYILSNHFITDDKYYNSSDNKGFGKYSLMKIIDCGITELKISVLQNDVAKINVNFMGKIANKQSSVIPDLSTGIMKRGIIYADCDVYLQTPEFHWDTSKSFEITIKNEIEPITPILPMNTLPENLTDQPAVFALGSTNISGEIIHLTNRGNISALKEVFPSGGLMGKNLIFDISGVVLIEFPEIVFHLTEQPIGRGVLERNSKFEVMFTHPFLTNKNETESTQYGHFIKFPQL